MISESINVSQNQRVFCLFETKETSNEHLLHIKECGMLTLAMRLLLLAAEQSEQRGLGHADDLETDSGNISHSMTGTTETGNEHLIVLINEVQTTIARDESSDLLTILDQLHTDALTNGRVRLLGLNSPMT